MKKFFCLSCENIWNDEKPTCCPECGSKDDYCVSANIDDEPSDFPDGHYEGEFKGLSFSHDDDSGE
jgi:hypothetical protein